MEPTASNSSIFFVAWNGLLTFILGQQWIENRGLRKELKAISVEREEHCIPRPECERTHKSLDERLSQFEGEVKDGIKGIHARLDKVLLAKKSGGCDDGL